MYGQLSTGEKVLAVFVWACAATVGVCLCLIACFATCATVGYLAEDYAETKALESLKSPPAPQAALAAGSADVLRSTHKAVEVAPAPRPVAIAPRHAAADFAAAGIGRSAHGGVRVTHSDNGEQFERMIKFWRSEDAPVVGSDRTVTVEVDRRRDENGDTLVRFATAVEALHGGRLASHWVVTELAADRDESARDLLWRAHREASAVLAADGRNKTTD